MIREERGTNTYFATIHTDNVDVLTGGEVQVFGVDLSDIVTVPAGMRGYVRAQVMMTGVDFTIPEYDVTSIDGMVLNNGGSISVAGGTVTNHANNHNGSDNITPALVAGSSGFGIDISHSGMESTGNHVACIITVVAHTYDLGN